jgi:hypothetical protein
MALPPGSGDPGEDLLGGAGEKRGQIRKKAKGQRKKEHGRQESGGRRENTGDRRKGVQLVRSKDKGQRTKVKGKTRHNNSGNTANAINSFLTLPP